ncbi:MAG: molybdopterin-guanine dinucleotide biosynthesis protein B [Clostridia bacterium]|nr:molybdopterin-guanine dinucleotide biosynthesis protein B [Clostridia bacterium]
MGFCASRSNMGKTTLISNVIRELKRRGVQPVVLKHGQHLQTAAGKDSARLVEAGAAASLYVSPEGLVLESRPSHELDIQSAARLLAACADGDILLVEGYKQGPQRKIAVCRKDVALELPAGVNGICAVVSDAPIETPLPQFRFADISALCDFIMENARPLEDEKNAK